MADPELSARLTTPGDPLDTLVDLNDGGNYTWDAESDLGTVGSRRTVLQASNVHGGTVASYSIPMMSALLVVNLMPQASVDDLYANYAALKAALTSGPSTLAVSLPGSALGDFLIDLDRADEFPNFVRGQWRWVPGCRPGALVDTFRIPVLRQPFSYGAGDWL